MVANFFYLYFAMICHKRVSFLTLIVYYADISYIAWLDFAQLCPVNLVTGTNGCCIYFYFFVLYLPLMVFFVSLFIGFVWFYGISTIVSYLMLNLFYTYILDIWFGLVLWHINHFRLSNAKSSLYIYIRYVGFGLIGFYGTSTIVGYLMPNLVYTYILDIYDLIWLDFMAYQPL